ncbi:DUF3307 domain-containing protein [Desulfotruncus alcoholivorax]|uniref:DUF3307 domain-containing protein n=1 Tax=Desulfotruncus alcoholivorax TaxID=265477 RepID=UPI0003FF4F54|nr:DUF3307 domain-containing protein [Desulfotruncus alcoholivorax]
MNLFTWLLVGHLVGDFIFQTRWMAEGKATKWVPLLVHSAVYTFCVYLLSLGGGGLSLPAVGFIFLTHCLLDRRAFIYFWTGRVTGAKDVMWLNVAVDQAWHIVVLAVATLL